MLDLSRWMLSSTNNNSTVTSGTFCVASDCDKSISSWIDVQVILLLIFNCPCANDIDSSVGRSCDGESDSRRE